MDNIPTSLDTLATTVKANKQKINDIESEGLHVNAQVIKDTQLLEQATTLSMKKQN